MTSSIRIRYVTQLLARSGIVISSVHALAACDGPTDGGARSRELAQSSKGSASADSTAAPSPTSPPRLMAQRLTASDSRSEARAASVVQPAMPATPMIIRTGNASIRVDSLEPAIAAVQRMATSLGGVVGNTMLSSGDYEVRSATLELRIPSNRFNEALEGLRPIGKVESVASNAQDVSEEFVDINARMANAKRLEERLISLLATRTGKLEEVLAVERELSRVREEIERYEGRIRYLSTRAATSTLSITVHEPAPITSTNPGHNVLADAFTAAWRNFVSFVAMLIASLGVLVPVGLIAVPVVIVARRRLRT